MTTRTATRRKAKSLTKPPKGWRNRWRALVGFDHESGATHYPGEEYDGEFLHPSKDIAETVAAESLAYVLRQHGYPIYEYLGAFPVEAS